MLKNIGSSWLLCLATALVTYFLMPFVIHSLGEAQYGSWILIASITGYIGMLTLGIPTVSVCYFAELIAKGDLQKLNQTIGICIWLYLILGVVAFLVGGGLFVLFLTYEIPSAWRYEAHLAFSLQIFYVSASFMGLIPESIMVAHNDFVRRNQVMMVVLLLRCALTIGLLTLKASLAFLALIHIVCLAFEFFIGWRLISRHYSSIRIRLGGFDWGGVRRIFSFSLYVLLLNVAGRLAFQTDSLVIGRYMDMSWIAYYAVANSLIMYLMEFVLAIAHVIMPMATKLQTEGKSSELSGLFLKCSKINLSITAMAGLFLIVFGPRFISWWIGPSFEGPAGQVLQILMVSNFVYLPARGVAQPILIGLGKPRMLSIAFFASAVLNLGLSILLVGPLGLTGVAIGTAVPNVAYALGLLILTCRELKISFLEYIRYVILRVSLGALPVLLLLLLLRLSVEVKGIIALGATGLAMALLFGVIWVLFVYRNDPYLDLRRALSQFVTQRQVHGRA